MYFFFLQINHSIEFDRGIQTKADKRFESYKLAALFFYGKVT